MDSGSRLKVAQGGSVVLGDVLAKGGEGRILAVRNRPQLVAKIFHKQARGGTSYEHVKQHELGLEVKARKVTAMVRDKPSNIVQADGHVVLTWPVDTLLGPGGSVVGYLMPRIDTTKTLEIHQLTNASDRMYPPANGPQWGRVFSWLFMVNIAVNLASAVELTHRAGAVIGDFNERNILVSHKTGVTLIDCDSMQFTDARGTVFPCTVGRPEFTAPELLGKNLKQTRREPSSDLFALAVHVYIVLLDGCHPFQSGVWTNPGEKPKAPALARLGYFAGGPGSPLKSSPTAPPITILPRQVQELFVRAFVSGTTRPASRPSAAEWHTALTNLLRSL
jgi:DNA-binding helix-hairpin-helix protein with protein kinase domain